jgi:glycine cleavage system H protein
MKFPEDLKYTREHEWVFASGDIALVGITEFAQRELGDIVYVEVETVDSSLQQGEVFGSVEAVKTVAELFMPISGQIIEFNEDLADAPELVNNDPYEDGWIIKVEMSNLSELEGLMTAEEYEQMLGDTE